jgi:hypothetical protein
MSLVAVARCRADANGETDLGRRRGYLRMVRRFMTRFGVALSVAAVVLSLGASAAFGGEVTGNGKPITIHANSACAFSGLDDNYPGTGIVEPGVVQNWGHTKDAPVVVAAPRGASDVTLNFGFGNFQEGCNAHLYPGK